MSFHLAGDALWVGELIDRHEKSLRYYVRGFSGLTHEDAEDVLQVIWLHLWLHPETLREAQNQRAMLYRMAKSLALNHFRNGGSNALQLAVHCELLLHSIGIGPDHHSLLEEEFRLKFLSQLSARQREVVELHHFQGLTVLETGKALGIGEGSVKQHLHRAYKRLREILGCRMCE